MKLAYAAVAAALLAASPVKAQVVDLSTITCADFSALHRPTRWPTSCSGSKATTPRTTIRPSIDFAEFKSTLEQLLDLLLEQSRRSGVLTAADEVMGNSDGDGN